MLTFNSLSKKTLASCSSSSSSLSSSSSEAAAASLSRSISSRFAFSFLFINFVAILSIINLTGVCQGYIIKEDESFLQKPHYASQGELEDVFARLAKQFPEISRVEVIGQSLEGRSLVVMQIGRNMQQRSILTPMTKFIGNMHGDETIGRQMLIYLAQYLLYNYNTNSEVAQLVNSTDIYLMPSMNPDGFARSQEGNCESLPHYVGRTNAAGIDLNRDFPDRLDNAQQTQLRSATRQPETAAIIEWVLSKPFVLSANFHGGAVVASYPYDNSLAHRECCEDSLTPDDRVFKLMAHTYANNNPLMRKGTNCNDTFTDGITNGAHWYELNGGMQDFNYAFSNCFEMTIELSCCKYPVAKTLPAEWQRNKHSLLQLLKLAHIGVKGIVKDVNGYPIHDASIVVSGLEEKPIRTTRRGEYWRMLTAGIYNIQAVAFGYQASVPQQVHITNDNIEAQRLDFTLSPVETNYDGAFRKLKVIRADNNAVDIEKNGGFLTPTKFEHHNFTAMEKFIREIADSYPTITRLYSIGKSVQERDLWVMEIFATPGKHIPGVPEFKYVANMHGNEVVGREMLLLLTKYICERYGFDNRITKMVNTTRMHFLYSMNPDGYEISKEGDKTSALGRANANNVDLNRNFPDQYGTDKYNKIMEAEVRAVINWTLSIPFVLSANLHGGSLVANYPYDDNENDFNDPMTRLRMANAGHKLNPTDDNELFKHLASIYANAHPTMHLGNPCPLFTNEVFPGGITNGAQWYSVTGGMQDWNYVKAGVMELTLELGCDKFPMATELPKYWQDNRESLLLFIEQAHNGIQGSVRSSIGTPVTRAAVMLDNSKHATYTGTYGDYWKLALPGVHNLTVLADGYSPHRELVDVPATGKAHIDVTLMRDDPQHWASANDYRIIENVVHTRYHTNSELRSTLAEFEARNGQIATFGYAESEFGFYYNSIKLTSDIGAPEEGKHKILILSSFFDSASPLGREVSLNLVRHIIEGYKLKEPLILKLLQGSILYFLPITENFEGVFKMFNSNNSICDPVIGNELGERILSPESEKRRDLLMTFLENQRFDLMLTFSTGNSELYYPKGEQIFEKFAHNIENTEFSYSSLQCPATSTQAFRHDVTERLTNFFYKMYNIPMFTLGLACCSMPEQKDITAVWRKNIEKLKNFLHLVDTGVLGFVHNQDNQPIREAFIRIIDHQPVYNVTKNEARFQLILPEGLYALEVSAPNFESHVMKVDIKHNEITNLGIIKLAAFTLITGRSEIQPLGSLATAMTTTIISGFVLDWSNHPVKHAKVSVVKPIIKHFVRNFTDSMGTYILKNVPVGEITLKVEAPRYLETTRLITVGAMQRGTEIKNVVFRLNRNEHVMGMPRFVFIILASLIIITGVVIFVLCAQCIIARRHRADKPYYNFSLLPQKGKELFEDDGDDGETELFRSPIKKGMTIKPYFDDDDDDAKRIIDSDEDDEDDDRHFNRTNMTIDPDDSGEEIIMLEKGQQHH